jgi:hypothetical protein
VVSFTPRPFYSRAKSCLYPLDRRMGGYQSWSGRYGEAKSMYHARNELVRERIIFIGRSFISTYFVILDKATIFSEVAD